MEKFSSTNKQFWIHSFFYLSQCESLFQTISQSCCFAHERGVYPRVITPSPETVQCIQTVIWMHVRVCSIPTWMMWSSLVISTASWQWSKAVKTELQALCGYKGTQQVNMGPCMYDRSVSVPLSYFFSSAIPEFELAAHLPMFDLYELIVTWWHAAVLHKPLNGKQGQVAFNGEGETQMGKLNEDLLNSDLFSKHLCNFKTIKPSS